MPEGGPHGFNYGYFNYQDDAMSWFYRNTLKLPEEYTRLLIKGKNNNVTTAEVSVTIKFSTEFLRTIGVWIRPGLHQIAAYTMLV